MLTKHVEHDVGQQPNHIHLDPTADPIHRHIPEPVCDFILISARRERASVRARQVAFRWVYDEIENTFNAPWFIIISPSPSLSLSLAEISEVCAAVSQVLWINRNRNCWGSFQTKLEQCTQNVLCLSSWNDRRSSNVVRRSSPHTNCKFWHIHFDWRGQNSGVRCYMPCPIPERTVLVPRHERAVMTCIYATVTDDDRHGWQGIDGHRRSVWSFGANLLCPRTGQPSKYC